VIKDEDKVVKETLIIKETDKVVTPAVPAKASWFRRAVGYVGDAAHAAGDAVATGAGAVAHGAESAYHGAGNVAKGVAIGTGALAVGAVVGTGLAANAAFKKVDGVWKRAVQVATTRKAKVDEKCPIHKHAFVYYDDDVYESILVDKKTGNKHITQLLYDSDKEVYYVFYRWSETDYTLGDSYDTLEEAKAAYLTHHKKNFDIEWTERSTVVSENWTIEEQVYEEVEEIEVIEEVIQEEEAQEIIKREEKTVIVDQTVGVVDGEKVVKVVTTTQETGVVAKPAVSNETSWFRRLAAGAGLAAAGAGAAAAGALNKVDGVWKRAVQVVTTRKAHVDPKSPIAKHSYVYYDDDAVYDAVLVDKHTGQQHITQLLFDSDKHVYYIYYRWTETDYKLDGPYESVEDAKKAYLISYKKTFDIEWVDRETAHSGKLYFHTHFDFYLLISL